ncbi:MAG: hypothetical protein QOE33_1088 [Acidobacteriota bacterium]|nr:hypothetical protein [Acidobacteriota bacterium]
METGHYRREFAAYNTAREVALYDFYTGATPDVRLEPARERYSDLCSRESIAWLERTREETHAQFETERAGLDALLSTAQLSYADGRAREAATELSHCESASSIVWDGERLRIDDARARIAEETDATRRHELAARWLDSIMACDDLRATRLEALRDAARELGFETYGELFAQATHTNYTKLIADAEVLLARTAPVYESRLAAWSARRLSPNTPRDLSYADELFFARLAELDRFFIARDARATFEGTLGVAGLRVERRANLRVEESARDEVGNAHCFGVRPPADVRLVFHARAGADFYLNFFYEAARAEQHAWTSSDLAARHPEFIHAPDRATRAGFGLLFRALFSDRAWLAEARGVRASEAEEIARHCALVELHDTRRSCALARDEFELLTVDDPRSESLAEVCAGRRREATGFRQSSGLCLFDLLRGDGASAGEHLRARLFAASMLEHLRGRHGSRWWSSRAAGGELIDLWNTGSRYAVEELARLACSLAPDAELLAASLNAAAVI